MNLRTILRCSIPFLFSAYGWAAGGACPSGANYINPASPAGPLVALASLGVTNCYYVAANGSDANPGTSESSPWLHAPGMPSATGNAASVWKATMAAGAGIILRGGDTWHEGNSGASPYTGGTWGFNNSPGPAGTSSNPIYVGVDPTWFSGSSFARPILTWDNPTTTSTTLSSCSYPSGNVVDFDGGGWFIFDDMELTGVCANSSNWNPIYVSYGSMSGGAYFERLYLHGSSHVGFPNPNNCTANSTCMSAFRGGVSSGGPPYDVFLFDVMDFSDSDPVPMEGCYCGAWEVAYSYFSGYSQFITRPPGDHLIHDNQFVNFVDNGHANVLESVGDSSGVNANYNNIYAHLYVSSATTSNVGFWLQPPVGTTDYFFNNLIWDAGPMEFFNIGQNGSNQGTISIFNNGMQFNHRTDGGADTFSCSATGNADPWSAANNQYITSDTSSMWAANCSGKGTDTTSLLMSNSTAQTDNYISAQSYVYSPTSSSSPTVGKGTNEQAFCSALATAAAADSSLSDAATACQSDTRYGVVYNSSNHTVSTPGRVPNSRPGSTAWDIGPYEYSNSISPAAPTNAKANAVPQN